MPATTVALLLSLQVAATATLAALVLGTASGWLLARARPGLRLVADPLFALPLVLPPTVMGYYLLVLLGSRGPLGHWLLASFGLRLVFTWQGAAIAATLVSWPLVHQSARAAFEEVPRALEDAARSLGTNAVGVFLRVSLPLAWRGVLAGTVLAFARSLGEFGATLMVAGSIPGQTETLSIAIYDAVQAGRDDEARELVLVAVAVSFVLLLAAGRLAPRRRQP